MKIATLKLTVGSASAISLGFPIAALAHCPLCTAGAGLVAVGAYWLGVNGLTIGVLLGAFAFVLGLWIGKIIKRKYIPQQDTAIGIFSWLTTILPLQMLFMDYTSIYINWSGGYGTLLNRTYPVNLFTIGSVIGAVIIYFIPYLSRTITKHRGKTVPYQGVILTFASLIFTSLITQFVL